MKLNFLHLMSCKVREGPLLLSHFLFFFVSTCLFLLSCSIFIDLQGSNNLITLLHLFNITLLTLILDLIISSSHILSHSPSFQRIRLPIILPLLQQRIILHFLNETFLLCHQNKGCLESNDHI